MVAFSALNAVSQDKDKGELTFPFEVIESRFFGSEKIGGRHLFIYLEGTYFVRSKLISMFTYFSCKYPDSALQVTVFTEKSKLISYSIAEADGIPDFSHTDEGKKAREAYIEKHFPSPTGYRRAQYHRNQAEEYFYYDLDTSSNRTATVVLREEKEFVRNVEFLFYSVKRGNLAAVKWIVEKPIELNIRDSYGTSPLEWAMSFHHNDIAVILVDAKADVEFRDSAGVSPLDYAVVAGNVEGARYLLGKNANVNAIDDHGRTALMGATFYCDIEMVRVLVANHADVSIKDKSRKTAVDYSCSDKKLLQMLTAK